jgi:hypothetical protein
VSTLLGILVQLDDFLPFSGAVEVFSAAIEFSMTFSLLHNIKTFVVDINRLIIENRREAAILHLTELGQSPSAIASYQRGVLTLFEVLHRLRVLDILATVAADPEHFRPKVCFCTEVCSFVESCTLKSKLFPLVARIFGVNLLKDVPKKYRLWSCSGHKAEYQRKKNLLLECDFVEKQCDMLRDWGEEILWVIQFRDQEERHLGIAPKENHSLQDVTSAIADHPSLFLGNAHANSRSMVYFIDLKEWELRSVLSRIRDNIQKTGTSDFQRVTIFPYRKGRGRWSGEGRARGVGKEEN